MTTNNKGRNGGDRATPKTSDSPDYTKPKPDHGAIMAALSDLFEPDDVIELRAFHKGRKRTDAGYFDGKHREALADAAAKLNATGAAVYVTLNRLDPQLLGRYCNRVENFASATATDANVIRRRWLLLDFDPNRPKDTSATEPQLEAAKATARKCYQALQADGWPEPMAAESGNGMHLLFPLDLPNDNTSRDLVKGALAGLAARFDDDVVKLDQSVFNAGRITKLYGTVGTKGDPTPATPWRLSRLVSTPGRDDVVTVDQLRAWHPAATQTTPKASYSTDTRRDDFDLPGFMSRLGIAYDQDTHEGAERLKLDHCPFNPEHGKGEAAIFRQAGGRLGFKCQHNSCADRTWQDVRGLVDGVRKARSRAQAGLSVRPVAEQHGDNDNAPGGDPDAWPESQPLAVKVAPEDYPEDALPSTIRAAVREVAEFVKAPLPMLASSALAALSLAIQAHADAKRAEKLHGPVGLFLLTIADSGERKSTCDGFFTRAIRDYEEAKAEAAKPIIKNHKADLEAWEAKRGGIKDKIRQLAKDNKPTAGLESDLRDLEHDKPEPPRIPRLLFTDATPEALAYGLAKNWPAGGVVSAEAGIVFGSHGMGKDSAMRNLGLLNQLWDGNSLTIDRRTTESFTVRGARLTVALQVQEPTLREFFTRSGALARGTGFLARFLVAWPESTQGFRPFTEAPENWPHLATFNKRIAAILEQPVPIDEDGALTPPMIPMTPEAKAAWIEYHDAIERELASGGELYDVRDVASKSADNAVRLAALFQIFEGGGAIGLECFESASRIAAWHLHEARRFFGELALPSELADAARLDSWLIEYCRRERTHLVGKNHVRRHGPLRNGDALDAAIRELADLDRVRLVKDGKRLTIKINPALVEVTA